MGVCWAGWTSGNLLGGGVHWALAVSHLEQVFMLLKDIGLLLRIELGAVLNRC